MIPYSISGTTAVSGSDDKTLIVWEMKRGLALTSLQMHVQFTRFDISLECSRIVVQLVDSSCLPVICLHNSPASYIKLPTYSAPARDVEDLRPAGPKRPARRLLKKEVSLDTYTWQKKYAHLTSSVMMAQVDERLKRRFSVSASMEEISKLAEAKNTESQANIGPEQAALAQSQHFDQLEALWNKRSPPRRRMNPVSNQALSSFVILSYPSPQSLSRQSSLVEDRIDSSDEDEFLEERAGTSKRHPFFSLRPNSLPVDAWHYSSLFHSSFTNHHQHHQNLHHHNQNQTHQPDLLREVLVLKKQTSAPAAPTKLHRGSSYDESDHAGSAGGGGEKLKLSSTETDLQALFGNCTNLGSLYCNARRKPPLSPECESRAYVRRRQSRSIENLRFEDEARLRQRHRSCLMQ